jgi:pimeloyl-ACP methyl ester carboxylesterase
MSRKIDPRTPSASVQAVHLRRLYADSRFGQLHVRSAFPSSGGFDEARTLVCVHDAGAASSAFREVLAGFGRDRSVYAPDLPGSGESEVHTAPRSIEDYAGAITDFADGLRLREFDLLAVRVGSQIAVEAALALPSRVRHLVLLGVPCLSAEERGARATAMTWPAAREDGSHLVEAWRRLRSSLGPTVALEELGGIFADRLRNAAGSAVLTGAGLAHATAERLMLVKQPTLVLRVQDDLAEVSRRAAALIPGARCIDVGGGPLPLRPLAAGLVQQLRTFLDN